jgi:hypothetical protein
MPPNQTRTILPDALAAATKGKILRAIIHQQIIIRSCLHVIQRSCLR